MYKKILNKSVQIGASKKNDDVKLEVPLKISFDSDYNIISLHERIIKNFFEAENEIRRKEVEAKIASLNRCFNSNEFLNNKNEILNLINCELDKLNNDSQSIYIKKSSRYLDEYKNLGPYQKIQNDYSSEITKIEKKLRTVPESQKEELEVKLYKYKSLQMTPAPEIRKRENIILNYFKILNEFFPVQIDRKNNELPECPVCNNVIIVDTQSKDGLQTCYICMDSRYGAGIQYITEKSNMCSNDKSDDVNIIKAFDRRACSQNFEFPPNLFDDLDEYFVRSGFLCHKEVSKMPYQGRFRGETNHSMLWKALEMTKYNSLYKHVELIGHKYWGWKKPIINHLREDFMNIYYKTQTAFNTITGKNRKSSISTQLRLYVQLELLGHECSIKEFKIPTGSTSIQDQIYLWKRMCELCNDPQIYYIPLK